MTTVDENHADDELDEDLEDSSENVEDDDFVAEDEEVDLDDDVDAEGEELEEDLDAVVELSSKEQSARSLEIRRAIEERMQERRLHEDLDYLDLDPDD